MSLPAPIAADLARPAGVSLQRGDRSARSGHAAMTALRLGDPARTAVSVANDQLAPGALSALAAAGRRVPEDVSAVGFDDLPGAAVNQPPVRGGTAPPTG